jgi:very-short-patch-repair endonuclease
MESIARGIDLRASALQQAVKVWTGQLVDLTARNNLLYFRDLKVGTLDVGEVEPAQLFEVLSGRTMLLSRLFEGEEALTAAVRRARTVRNRAQEHFEERGLETLYLACGMATWENQRGTATPCAPVLLVPARLVPRGAAQDDFELSVTGELEVNPTLLQMLASEFDVTCSPEDLTAAAGMDGAIDTPEELDIAFSWLTDHARGVPGFGVSSRFVLGTFSYAKLPMVKDLEGAVEAMMSHELIAALAGDHTARAAVREGHAAGVSPTDPNHIPAADEFLVLDADASQNYAINAAVAGQDLVIKGPPGTGKSQTIANLIATSVARGKRVLFVAEKRAAIDAVLRRLESVGLGDIVLDMHGGGGSRRQVAQGLATALVTNASISRGDYAREHQLLETRREELNERVMALHHPREPWGVSFFQAQTRILGLDETLASNVRFRGVALQALTGPAYEQAREHLRSYAGLGGLRLTGSNSPWSAAPITSSEQCQAAQSLVERLRDHTLPTTVQALTDAADASKVKRVESFTEWRAVLGLWKATEAALERWHSGIFSEDLQAIEEALQPLGQSAGTRVGAALTSAEFRAARKRVKARLRDGVKLSPAELLAEVTTTHELSNEWARHAVAEPTEPTVPPEFARAQGTFDQLQTELQQLATTLGRTDVPDTPAELRGLLDSLLADTVTLGRLPELHRLRLALQAIGLSEFLDDAAARSLPPEAALAALEHAWLWSLVDHIRLTDSRVGAFDGDQHNRTVAEFQKADRRHIDTTAQRVRRLVAEQATRAQDEFEPEGALIRDQAARKRGHLSMRQLFSGAPNVMMALKPCWAMSPLVVSQLLPSDQQYFDLVVFDEASQVRPADAIPAILRGKRVVVAGDERQLPPTDFFTGSTPEDEPAMEGRIVVDSGFESILEGLLPFLDFRMLSWHYRSRDERLIAFSNVHLYDRGLTTFPGVTGPDAIQHVLVPYAPGETGSETSTSAEVQRVVELIIDHAQRRPHESLGVITMGIKHADRIEEQLRRTLSEQPSAELDEFFDETKADRFFIKNLERVQGDERDAIILSIGYGKNADGRLLYRFGPLNQEGGERRLNVAITRARNRLTLVSAFSFSDMEPGRSSARGVELMRFYLQYADSRGEKLGDIAADIPELNPFEVDIRDALTRVGIPLTAQYGASGFRIDFAAQHPEQPGRMVLAIECDGASYHSSETARDRDRLRQEQLERLGWTFHRIWSQDWFTDKQRETEKALAAYKTAVANADRPESQQPVVHAPAVTSNGTPATPAPRLYPRPAFSRYLKIDEYSRSQLRDVVRWVKSDTLLRTQDQLLAEVMKELGFQKRGSRIVAALTAAITAEG